MTTFSYSTGNPANLTGGAAASMNDIQGPFTDVRTFINGGNFDSTNIATGPTLISTQQAWQTIALTGLTGSLSYFKDSLGIVHFRGDQLTATSPAGGSTLCTLPVGYRPGVLTYLGLLQTNANALSLVTIDTAGAVKNLSALSTNTWSFGMMHFRAEN